MTDEDKLKQLENVKTVIRSILISSANQSLNVNKLCDKYHEFEGVPLPFRSFGCYCAEDFLQTIPDVLRFKKQYYEWTIELAQNTSQSVHIAKLVSEQKKSQPRRKRRQPRTRNYKPRQQSSYNSRNSYRQPSYQDKSAKCYQDDNYTYSSPKLPVAAQNRNSTNNPVTVFPAEYRDTDETSSIEENDWIELNEFVNLKQDDYINNSIDSDFPNVTSLEPNQNDKILNTANVIQQSVIDSTESKRQQVVLPKKSRIDILKSVVLKTNLEHENIKIIENKRKCESSLSNNSTQESSLIEKFDKMFRNKPDIVRQAEILKSNDEKTILSDYSELPSANDDYYLDEYDDDDDAVPELDDDDPLFQICVPDGCVGSSKQDQLQLLPIPENLKVGSVVKLVVAEVYDPFRFWFHFDSEIDQLDEMMKKIQMCYKRLKKHELKIHPVNCSNDMLCMALYQNVWHRGKILCKLDGKCKVYFIDYGTVSEVDIKDIKYMKNDFLDAKCQCFHGCLDFVRPTLYHWQQPSNKCFLSMVKDQMLYAKVTEIDYQKRLVYMIMINTNGPNDININDLLIEEGYAMYYDAYQLSRFSNNWNRKQYFSEKRPTFELLESGMWPSFADITAMIYKGYDFYKQLDETP